MQYFDHITDFTQAKQRYRQLVKEMHPDKGGSQSDFQEMQQEYQALLLQLNKKSSNMDSNSTMEENDIINELGKLGRTLLKTQIPQKLLKQKIKNSQNPYEKLIYKEIGKLSGRLLKVFSQNESYREILNCYLIFKFPFELLYLE